jgi:hypothetical protein
VLEVARDADDATVRRAYARKLKSVRPDVDPAGFQELVEARDALLSGFYRDFVDDDEAPTTDLKEVVADGPITPDGAVHAAPSMAETIREPRTDMARIEPAEHVAAPALIPSADSTTAPSVTRVPTVVVPMPSFEPATADDVIDLLATGLAHETPLTTAAMDDVLARMPAGAMRGAEWGVARALADAATKLGSQTYPNEVHDAYERAAVRLAEIFGWAQSDRTIYEALAPDDARILLVYLGRAHRRHAPEHTGRFAQPVPAAARETRRWFSWRSLWTWCLLIYLIAQLARCMGDPAVRSPALPTQTPVAVPILPFDAIMTREKLEQALAVDKDASMSLLIAASRPARPTDVSAYLGLASLRTAHVALGLQDRFDRLVELLQYDTATTIDRPFFERSRAGWWMDRHGWALGGDECNRRKRLTADALELADEAKRTADIEGRFAAIQLGPLTQLQRPLEVELLSLADIRVAQGRADEHRRLLDDLIQRADAAPKLADQLTRLRRCLSRT